MATGKVIKHEVITERQNFNIAKNSSAAIYNFTVTTPSGYRFISPASWMPGNNGISIYGVRKQSDTQIGIYASNPSNTDVTCQVQLLFEKN